MIDRIESYILNANRQLVIDREEITALELVGKTASATNECIDKVNTFETEVNGLLGEGLNNAVNEKLQQMLDNGTLDNVINVGIFGELDTRIDKLEFLPQLAKFVDNYTGANDTEKLQNAINDLSSGETLVIEKTYTIASTLTITNKSNIRITGRGKIILTGTNTICFKMIGVCSNIEIDSLTIKGDGISASGHIGISNDSGQTISNVKIHDLTIQDVTLGISLNADLSGSFSDSSVYKNILTNIVGGGVGQGYGIHMANTTNCIVERNTIDGAQRHSIYHAKGGTGDKIIFNFIRNHRQANYDGNIRPSIECIRSNNVLIAFNTLQNCYDTGIHVASEMSFECSHIDVIGNTIIDMKNSAPSIVCGELATPTTVFEKCRFINNKVIYNNYGGGVPFKYYNGKDIEIRGNSFIVLGVTNTCIVVELADNLLGSLSNSDNVRFIGNTFDIEGTNLGSSRGYHLNNGICTGTINIEIKDDMFINGANYTGVVLGTGQTNSKLVYQTVRTNSAITDTSSATLTALETEVNKLKTLLRNTGVLSRV